MRTWFHQHPNVTMILLGLWVVFTCLGAIHFLKDREWVPFAANAIAFVFALPKFYTWWERT